MATPYSGPQFGLLPDRRISWQTLATSYGIELMFILLLVNVGLLFPEKLQLKQNYHLTELIPLRQPKPLPRPKTPALRAKLLPAAPITAPHLVVPREIRAIRAPEPEPAPVDRPRPAALSRHRPAGSRVKKAKGERTKATEGLSRNRQPHILSLFS